MERRKTRQLSFSEIKAIIDSNRHQGALLPYIEKDMVMAIERSDIMVSVMQENIPIKADDMRLFLLKAGKANVTFNLRQHQLAAGDLVFVSAGSIIQVNQFTSDADLEAFSVSPDRLQMMFGGRPPEPFARQMYDFHIHLSDTEQHTFHLLFASLWQLVNQSDHDNEAPNSLMATIIHEADRLYRRDSRLQSVQRPHDQQIFDRFIALVNEHVGQEHALNFYADQLCISPRYLGTLVKQVSGQTAKEWIDRALIMDIKVKLKHSDMQIKQISDRLNFPNVSFFCKYFKRLTGHTPNDYREGE
uniref:Helix-turn-helix transcriptional regulator n=1 Tax=Prevotella sp. GTC17262 TaxID=3236797 RepID=A0AB33JIE5_9BACT